MTRKLKPNTDKIIEAILYLITRSDQKKRVVTQCDIVKAFWLADTWHLEKSLLGLPP
jgi:hypothetical protein